MDTPPLERPLGQSSASGLASAFAMVFEHHQAVALLIEPATGAIVDANPAAAVFYGYSLGRLRSMSLTDLEEGPAETVKEECALAIHQVRQRFDVIHRTSSGECRPVEVLSSPVRWGDIAFLCDIVMDSSLRKEAERESTMKSKELATLLEVSQAMTMALDLPSVTQTIIEKAVELVGFDTGAIYLLRGPHLHLEATTPPLPLHTPEEIRSAPLDEHPQIAESLRRNQPLAIEETEGYPFSRQERAVIEMRGLRSILYIPLVIERRPIGILIVGTVGHPRRYTSAEIDLCRTFSVQAAIVAENALMYDTTKQYARELESRILERDRAQQERLQLEHQLFQAQRRESIGTLASGIAHDFNNILSIIVGNASLLTTGTGGDGKDAHRIEAILTAADRATRVVQQLLTIARKTEMVRRPTDIGHLIQELCRLLRETFPRNITIRHDLAPDLPATLADPNQLHQVLLNLCVNARDAMPQGGEISLTARTVGAASLRPRHSQVEGRLYTEICVCDTGTGMDETTRTKAFTPFFTTKGVGQGTGLGLAVSLGIVESHGGFMDVQSEPGSGTSMYVYLPAGDGALVRSAAPMHAGGRSTSETVTVLLIEDEPLLRESVTDLLERKGFKVLPAGSGDEALECVGRGDGRVGVVLSDFGLPGYDGGEVLRRLREQGIKAPFIVMTGFLDIEKRMSLQRAGVREIIMKPFDPDTLVARILAHVEQVPAQE